MKRNLFGKKLTNDEISKKIGTLFQNHKLDRTLIEDTELKFTDSTDSDANKQYRKFYFALARVVTYPETAQIQALDLAKNSSHFIYQTQKPANTVYQKFSRSNWPLIIGIGGFITGLLIATAGIATLPFSFGLGLGIALAGVAISTATLMIGLATKYQPPRDIAEEARGYKPVFEAVAKAKNPEVEFTRPTDSTVSSSLFGVFYYPGDCARRSSLPWIPGRINPV